MVNALEWYWDCNPNLSQCFKLGNYLESSCPLSVAAANAASLRLKFLLVLTLLVANDRNPTQSGTSRKGPSLAH